jgi:hypothetical protein
MVKTPTLPNHINGLQKHTCLPLGMNHKLNTAVFLAAFFWGINPFSSFFK